jgi:hypothetical protein
MKNGIISNKKEKYCDLLYIHKEHSQLIEWVEQMELSCKDMIDNKKQIWFQSDLTRNDLDNMMTPITRMYKSGSSILLRCYIDINKHNGKHKCLIYDENEKEMDISCVDSSNEIIPLLHIEGIRFSHKTFELDIKLTQMMVMDNEENKPNIMIKRDLCKKENESSLGKEDIKKVVFFDENNKKESVSDNLSEETKKESVSDNLSEETKKESVSDNLSENNKKESVSDNLSENNKKESVSDNKELVSDNKDYNDKVNDKSTTLEQNEIMEISLENIIEKNDNSDIIELKKPK